MSADKLLLLIVWSMVVLNSVSTAVLKDDCWLTKVEPEAKPKHALETLVSDDNKLLAKWDGHLKFRLMNHRNPSETSVSFMPLNQEKATQVSYYPTLGPVELSSRCAVVTAYLNTLFPTPQVYVLRVFARVGMQTYKADFIAPKLITRGDCLYYNLEEPMELQQLGTTIFNGKDRPDISTTLSLNHLEIQLNVGSDQAAAKEFHP